MKTEMRQQLVAALYAAAEAARLADPGGAADGGTCNFDSPVIRIAKVQDKDMQAIAKQTGITLYPFNWRLMGGRWYKVGTPMLGQGNRRTTMMEAALEVLEAKAPEGVFVMSYYQVD